MSPPPQSIPRQSPSGRLPPWLTILLFVVVLAVAAWQTRPSPDNSTLPDETQRHPAPPSKVTDDQAGRSAEPAHRPIDVEVTADPEPHPDTSANADVHSVTRIERQTIRDQDGRIVFQGTIDLQPTLHRIRLGKRNEHRNDGTTFQNRERRLPAKVSGYYREFVHPTPKLNGPGPQRVIVGKDGDVWYTPDHYKSFQKIK